MVGRLQSQGASGAGVMKKLTEILKVTDNKHIAHGDTRDFQVKRDMLAGVNESD